MKTALTAFSVLVLSSGALHAQSFNVAIGPTAQQPSSAYAAAGLPGYWNSLPAAHNTTTFNLRNLDGTVTNVNVWQYGGLELRSDPDPATTGDDQTLLDHCLITYTPTLETCLFFRQLQPADYEVIIYAWMPNRPDVLSYTNCDEEPGNPDYLVGGPWPGEHRLDITHSRHIATVTTQFNGLLRVHSGIAPGQESADGAACNGVQIRMLPPKAPGDMNCDGLVNALDIQLFVVALTDPERYYAAAPTCRIDNADTNFDYQIAPDDVPTFIGLLLAL
jgi:hypothetical protein